jgi:hypothetical protein
MIKKITNFALLFSFLAFTLNAADLLKVGDTYPTFTTQDQHEVEFTLTGEVQYLMISFDMTTGKKANAYLTEKSPDFFSSNKVVYMANIYGMPWIGRKFAMPKMKKYNHRILIADEEGLLDPVPTRDGEVTIVKLSSQQKIEKITFWNPKEELILE